MNRLKEIEMRLAAIKQEIEKEDADIDALNQEVDELLQERKLLLEKEQQRQKLLSSIAAGECGEGTPVAPVQPETRSYGVDSAEYRSAYLKKLRGLELSQIEQRAMTTNASSAGAAVPTVTLNKILEKVKQYAPVLNEIDLLNIRGYVTVPAEGTTIEAQMHTEGKEIKGDDDTLHNISLGGYEITKLITISKSVETMSMDAFEEWLVRKLSREVAYKISKLIYYGTGVNQAQGINMITWNDSNSIHVAANANLTETNVINVIGLLNGGYDTGAKWYMSKKTFFEDFYPLMNKAKNITVTVEGGRYYVGGYEVSMDERITYHEAFLGNVLLGYIGNMPEQVNVTSQFVTRENSYDFLGAAMFDGKVSAVEAFVKIIKDAE